MSNNKIDKYINVSTILFAVGLMLIVVGIYYKVNDFSTSGPRMGRYGIIGTGTLNGKGLIFIGVIISGAGIILRKKNRT